MKSILNFAGAATIALTLAACDQPAPWARAAVAPEPVVVRSQRAQAVAWNDDGQRFEINGAPLKAGRLWTFDGSTEGFVVGGGEVLPANPIGMDLRNNGTDSMMRSPKGLALDGSRYSLVLVRLTRTRAGADWDGSIYYSTAGHGEAGEYHAKPRDGADPAVNETVVLVYDMANLKTGGDDWTNSLIDQIRVDTDEQAGGYFVVHQIAVTENPGVTALGQGPVGPTTIAQR
ncbi:MAG: hypothetical protein C0481_02665 [Phenylobacterium sp.]|uniref:hypothetical protein n=1 Tax=Phenylobacterium sp. TaxID=1871053 RepID=UPI0025CF79DA|nr:hypothetical protein [Phenylobacterium sp.]MBA4010746.1 hypothetical protein [Phenylobacterium sp.]